MTATDQPRPGRPRDPATDAAITSATFRLLQREGYQGLSVEAVAAEAGVAKTTIYRRYPAKRDLVVAALLAQTPVTPPAIELPTREALDALVRMAVHLLTSIRAIHILATFVVEEDREPALLETLRERLVEPRRAILVGILRRGIERGEVRPDADLDLVSEMMLGALFAHHVRGKVADEAWVAALVQTVWAAVEAR